VAKKYQIFVSSTFRDLADERQDAIRSILDLGHIPAGMELFPAADTEQLEYIKKVIDECDYYVLIMGGRYGSLDAEGVSFTEREYDYAVDTGKVVLAFVHGNASNIPVGKADTAPKLVQSLEDFRSKVMDGRLVRQWTSRENLEALVVKSIARATTEYPAIGWIRGDAAASEELLQQMNNLRVENEKLKKESKRLLSATKPVLDGLADMSEKVELTFRRSYSYNGRESVEMSGETFTWQDIFVAVGIGTAVPKSSKLISALLIDKLKLSRPTMKYKTLTEHDQAIVKNQLVALGLIRAYVANTTKGEAHEFMQISELGKKKLAEHLAVKAGVQVGPSLG
jgi:hypothetical protein